MSDSIEPLELWDFNYFDNLKEEKDFIVKGLLDVKSLNMLFAPPKVGKSLLALYIAACVSSGKPCLGLKTKQKAVLYCDKENKKHTIKKRWREIRKGASIRKRKHPLYFLPKKEGDLKSKRFLTRLKKTIIEKNIKLLIFDTLHRYGKYQENSADDISELYTDSLTPIIELGVTIIYIHHTGKNGEYRGSIDLIGICDGVFKIKKNSGDKVHTLINTESRGETVEPIKYQIHFLDNKMLFETFNGPIADLKKLNEELLEKVPELFTSNEIKLTAAKIKSLLESKGKEVSKSSVQRVLNELVKRKILRKLKERGGYSKNAND